MIPSGTAVAHCRAVPAPEAVFRRPSGGIGTRQSPTLPISYSSSAAAAPESTRCRTRRHVDLPPLTESQAPSSPEVANMRPSVAEMQGQFVYRRVVIRVISVQVQVERVDRFRGLLGREERRGRAWEILLDHAQWTGESLRIVH